MMDKELRILNTRIDRAIKEVSHLNALIAAASGHSSVSREDLNKMATSLKDNAYIAIHEPVGFVPKALLRGTSNG